jgi:hypothetical protein
MPNVLRDLQPIWFEAEYIAQETGMNGLPASENGFSQRSNQSTETGRLNCFNSIE